ncbi:hypothetical protein ANO11243_071550 [Dothideomycetidae sp. 11243]|nr:hypothetical protein ANO11243_071550 [fungal sp. No.11243]
MRWRGIRWLGSHGKTLHEIRFGKWQLHAHVVGVSGRAWKRASAAVKQRLPAAECTPKHVVGPSGMQSIGSAWFCGAGTARGSLSGSLAMQERRRNDAILTAGGGPCVALERRWPEAEKSSSICGSMSTHEKRNAAASRWDMDLCQRHEPGHGRRSDALLCKD